MVPRERFLPPGPWTVRSEADFGGPARQTPDDDPRHVYHNLSVAIDPARQLFNGPPSLVALCIERRPDVIVLDYRLPDVDGVEVRQYVDQ